jgi:hypothetical protein
MSFGGGGLRQSKEEGVDTTAVALYSDLGLRLNERNRSFSKQGG